MHLLNKRKQQMKSARQNLRSRLLCLKQSPLAPRLQQCSNSTRFTKNKQLLQSNLLHPMKKLKISDAAVIPHFSTSTSVPSNNTTTGSTKTAYLNIPLMISRETESQSRRLQKGVLSQLNNQLYLQQGSEKTHTPKAELHLKSPSSTPITTKSEPNINLY